MAMKQGFTLIEMIVTIVILGILSAGTFVSLQHLYARSAKAKALSELSLESQRIVDQISMLIYERVPSSVIGYNPNTHFFESIYTLDANFTILEWIGIASEAHKLGIYSGFVDMNASNSLTKTLKTLPTINKTALEAHQTSKFGGSHTIETMDNIRLVFSASFDDGGASANIMNAFGWHGTDANQTYKMTNILNSNELDMADDAPMREIYEKYYLVDSAYAIARGEHINQTASCITQLNIPLQDMNNTLFLFFNYRPWKGQTFCADPHGGTSDSNVTILSKEVASFESGVINSVLYFNLGMQRKIKGSENNVTISKQKAVY